MPQILAVAGALLSFLLLILFRPTVRYGLILCPVGFDLLMTKILGQTLR